MVWKVRLGFKPNVAFQFEGEKDKWCHPRSELEDPLGVVFPGFVSYDLGSKPG